jgi:hypothetical protein
MPETPPKFREGENVRMAGTNLPVHVIDPDYKPRWVLVIVNNEQRSVMLEEQLEKRDDDI